MASFDVNNHESLGVSSKVPSFSKFQNTLKSQDIVLNRRHVTTPSDQSTYIQNQELRFELSSDSSYILPDTSSLNFNIKTSDATSCLSDFPATCWVKDLRILLNGKTVEHITDVNQLCYAQASQIMSLNDAKSDYYNMCGSYKWNLGYESSAKEDVEPDVDFPDLAAATSGVKNVVELLNLFRQDEYGVDQRIAEAKNAHFNGLNLTLPLSLISGFCRSRRMFPLPNAKVEIVIRLATNNEAMIQFAEDSGHTYTISNVELGIDMVDVAPEYQRLIQAEVGGEEGFYYPINTYEVVVDNTNVPNSVSQQTYQYTSSAKRVKSMILWRKTADDVKNIGDSIASLPCGITEQQLIIGSRRYPESRPFRNPEEMFAHTKRAIGDFGQVTANLGWSSPETYKAEDKHSTFAVIYNFEKIQDDGLELDTLSLSNSGAKFQIKNTENALNKTVYQYCGLEVVLPIKFARRLLVVE